MQLDNLLGLLAVLSLGSGALTHPHPYQKGWDDYVYNKRHIVGRQAPLLNSTRPASSTQPPITPAPSRISSTFTTLGPTSSAPATSTISNGETVVAVIGATYVAGVGGATLMVGGTPHALAAGTIVTITAGGSNGDTPNIETVSNPNQTQDPKTTDPASRPVSSSNPVTPTPTSSSYPTSSSAPPSSSAAVPTPYIILASTNATKEEIQAVNSTLSKQASSNSLQEVISDRTGLVVFFKANISPSSADAIAKEPGVAAVTPDEALEEEQPPSSSSPASSVTRHPTATGPPGSPKTSVPNPVGIRLQSDAVDELKVISQPGGVSLADLPGYGYADEAGKGVTIYVVDTGVNAQNTEWSGMPGTKSFLYAPGATKDETDFLNHGSCVASKAGGPIYGTAKDADMVAVKMPSDFSMSAIFTALIEISNDVFQKKLEGKAVINISLVSRIRGKLSTSSTSTSTAYKLLLVALMAEDIVVVSSSGNDRQYGINDVTTYPALFGPTTDMIVVGAVRNDGYRASFSQGSGSQLTVSAPGIVYCADGKAAGSQATWGTSFAAPAVAGVIAVWLSQDEHKDRLQVPGKVAANVKEMVQSLAYPRVEGGPAVIWNGIDPRNLACSANTNRKRQGNPSGGSCQATSAAASSIATSTSPARTTTVATTSAAPSSASASSTAQPSPPPKPTWSESPQGFTKAFEQDGAASDSYDASSDSASEGVTDNIEGWCLNKCTGSCASVFLFRVLQFTGGKYNIYYICNQYNMQWSNDFVQTISTADSGIAFNKS